MDFFSTKLEQATRTFLSAIFMSRQVGFYIFSLGASLPIQCRCAYGGGGVWGLVWSHPVCPVCLSVCLSVFLLAACAEATAVSRSENLPNDYAIDNVDSSNRDNDNTIPPLSR